MIYKLFTALIMSVFLGSPLVAQQWQMPHADDNASDSRDGTDPLSGIDEQLDGAMGMLFKRLQPHLNALGDELADTANEFSPALNELSGLIDDIRNYASPERLPNGDIIIRRRADAPPPPTTNELQRLLPDRNGTSEGEDDNFFGLPHNRDIPEPADKGSAPSQTEL